MKVNKVFGRALIAAPLIVVALVTASPALADDVGVSINVASTSSAPSPKTDVNNTLGIKSDAAPVDVVVEGLEPGKNLSIWVDPVAQPVLSGVTDSSGNFKARVNLPYGLMSGEHSILAKTFFGSDNTPATYELGRVYVSDLGILTDALGNFPKHTTPSLTLPSTSLKLIRIPPRFIATEGAFNVSEPIVRVSDDISPKVLTQVTFRNSTNTVQNLGAEVWLADAFGNRVSKVFYTPLNALEPNSVSIAQYRFDQGFLAGFYSVQTKLILPDNFSTNVPVQTSFESQILVLPRTLFVVLVALVAFVGLILVARSEVKRAEA